MELTPELNSRLEQLMSGVPMVWNSYDDVYDKQAVLLMLHAAYQLDRSDLFTREEVERIAAVVREICAGVALESKTDMDCRDNILQLDINQLIKK